MSVYEKGLITVLACSLLFAGLAIPLLLRRVRRNPVYGYRTRATLASDRVWYEANACFGRWLLAGSLASALATAFVAIEKIVSPQGFLTFSVVALAAPVTLAGLLTARLVRTLTPKGG